MAKFVGTIEKTDLEGGSYLLRSEQGVVYQLKGGGDDLRSDGRRVSIEGEIATGTVGIAMMGEVLEVKSYRFLD